MNPGPCPSGWTQDALSARSPQLWWMSIDGPVRRPKHQHPKRPIEGFDCKRSEVGRRLWGWPNPASALPTRSSAIGSCSCPVVFLEASGPTSRSGQAAGEAADRSVCGIGDRHLAAALTELRPEWAIGGAPSRRSASALCSKAHNWTARWRAGLHRADPAPEPRASPAANRGWSEAAERQLSRAWCGVQAELLTPCTNTQRLRPRPLIPAHPAPMTAGARRIPPSPNGGEGGADSVLETNPATDTALSKAKNKGSAFSSTHLGHVDAADAFALA